MLNMLVAHYVRLWIGPFELHVVDPARVALK